MSSDSEKIAAGPEAELLVAFVNTRDLELDTDAIAKPQALAAWAAEHVGEREPGVAFDPQAVDPAAHARLLALRESLRALLRANNGGELAPGQLAALREVAGRSRYRAALSAGDRLALEPVGSGVEALEARLLLAVERAQALGEWSRLKACPAGDCEWAFFDTSRNRSRTWCSMEVCGNRAKTRRYRRRRGTS